MKKTKAQLEAELLRVQGKLQDMGRTSSAVMGERDAAISAKAQAEVESEAMRIGKLKVEADLRRITVELNEALRERDNAMLACRMLAAKSEAIDELTAKLEAAERERDHYNRGVGK